VKNRLWTKAQAADVKFSKAMKGCNKEDGTRNEDKTELGSSSLNQKNRTRKKDKMEGTFLKNGRNLHS
jgi:hypothetical protein